MNNYRQVRLASLLALFVLPLLLNFSPANNIQSTDNLPVVDALNTTALAKSTLELTTTCEDPLTCDPVTAIPAYWQCNLPGCTGSEWFGAAISWPEWAAYENNGRTGNNSRTVYNYDDEIIYPYMGSWADGCQVTAVTGLVLIIEWERGTDVWRETFLEPGESHTISLIPPEDGAMIETIDGIPPAVDFSVSLDDCNPGLVPKTFTLAYFAGSGGSLSGHTVQFVDNGQDGTPVTAVPDANHHFVDWSDGSTDNPRTDINVITNMDVTANFAIDTFTLDYAAGTGGSLSGDLAQIVEYGQSGTAVTAVPDANYHFVDWSDGSTDNPRTDTNVTTNMAVTANFAINTVTLDYAAGTGGSLSGDLAQIVEYGQNGTAVTAVPDVNYHFVDWSDGSTDNPRTDTNVTTNLAVTANFAIDTFTLDYAAGAGGSLDGDLAQIVDYNQNGTAVTAVSDTGYHFVGWSDGSTSNPRTDTNVTTNLVVTANFAIDTFTLDYAAGTGGSLSGDLAQIVEYGQSGTPVTAVSDANYHFVNWSDGSTSNPRSDTNVTTNVAVTANFAEVVYNLTIDVNSVEGGTTDPPMGVHTYAAGTEITLTATANPGWIFAGWSGDLTSNENSITITITNNQTIIANFKYQIFVPIVAR